MVDICSSKSRDSLRSKVKPSRRCPSGDARPNSVEGQMYLPIIPLQAGFVCVMDGTVLLSGVCLGIRRRYLDVFPLSGRC